MEKEIEELWVPIKGYEHYEVSNLGRVRKISYLRTTKTKGSAYQSVQLFHGDGHGKKSNQGKKGCTKVSIHRLVAQHFLSSENCKTIVNHLDGDKENNRVENLEWCTHGENIKHAYDNGLRMQLKGSKCGKRINQLEISGHPVRVWNGMKECVSAGYTPAKIYGAIGTNGKYRGSRWEYAEDYFDYEVEKVFVFDNGKRKYTQNEQD